jgi:hypothetical protein
MHEYRISAEAKKAVAAAAATHSLQKFGKIYQPEIESA